jgi:hypothetical protein
MRAAFERRPLGPLVAQVRGTAKGRRIAFVTQGMKIISISSSLLVSACSLSWYINAGSGDYNNTVETVTNNVMVTNILRGRDSAPLSFSDLSQIRGSVTTSASTQFSWPFGPFGRDVSRTDTAQLGPLSISNAPTFDIAPLNTKIFAEGINEPVSLSLMWYYLQRFDASVILPLFISRVEIVDIFDEVDGTTEIKSLTTLSPDQKTRAMSIWIEGGQNNLPAKVNVLSQLSAVGPSLSSNILMQRGIISDLAAASTAGLQLKAGPDGRLHLTKNSAHAVLCVSSDPAKGLVHYQALAIARSSVVTNPAAIDWPNSDTDCVTIEKPAQLSMRKPSSNGVRQQILVHLRSVEAMFYYLGKEISPNRDRLSEYLHFYLYDHPIANERFRVAYRGDIYYVAEASQVANLKSPENDYTIAILGLLNDLLNLHRDATEIPTTKAVQTVP